MITVKDMATVAKTANRPLLSDYDGDFWAEYRTNFKRWDAAFARRYASFFNYVQMDTAEETTDDFTDAVYMHLWLNNKKYSELYRLAMLDGMEITNSYNVTTTETRSETRTGENVKGAETETHTITAENKADVTGSTSETVGARHDYTTFAKGEETGETINKVSPYNADGEFQDNTASQSTSGTRLDNGTSDTGEQSNSSDTATATTTTENRSDAANRSDRHDTATETATATATTERHGNIGNSTQATNAQAYVDFWNNLECLYDKIFNDIAAALLCV